MNFVDAHGKAIEVAYQPARPLDTPDGHVPPFHPQTVRLEQGYVHEEGHMPLPAAILWQQDVSVPLRDGTIIYADVYRPDEDPRFPTILAWTPYGKQDGWFKVNVPPEKFGAAPTSLSGLQSWEAPDPAYWVDQGYAVVVIDVPGLMHSGGNALSWGSAGGRQLYDAIEWVASQTWSNSRVGMSGNSQLAIQQWFGAAEQPPHLAAIAPWEASFDLYRDSLAKGGIPETGFHRDQIAAHYHGLNQLEAADAMLDRYPLQNSYWADKRAQLERVEVPAYVVASYSNSLHARGTLEAFNTISSTEKWLRIHNIHEWPDLYQPDNVEDLRRFFDHYLKGEDNGWQDTPRVRMSVLDPGGHDEIGRVESHWPPTAMTPEPLFLAASDNSLRPTPTPAAPVSYRVEDAPVVFRLPIEQETEIAGPIKLKLWVEAVGADDMDLFAQVYKVDADGNKLFHIAVPGPAGDFLRQLVADGKPQSGLTFAGPQGRLRVSHRHLDPDRSTPLEPMHTHDREEMLSPGQIVPIEIGIWPVAMKLHRGETLCLAIGVHPFDDCGSPGLPGGDEIVTRNKGTHVIHTGGAHDSHILLPYLR